jgi:hypothetical protein
VVQAILAQNDGFRHETYFRGDNFRESRVYTIKDGQVLIHSTGKTSGAHSRFDDTPRRRQTDATSPQVGV